MTNMVQTQVLTLKKIDQGGHQFNIPCYQRPYVWPNEDVLRLFDDIRNAFENNKKTGKEPHYFIGTVLTSIEDGVYELIDGQQRTTTLMLIAIAFKSLKVECRLAGLAAFGSKPRLQFSIREQVQHLLGSMAELEGYQKPSAESIRSDIYLTRMDAALKVLTQQVDNLEECKRYELAEYIYSQVQWVNNVVPHQMDLNRLFATMNTSGIQLEQADILKSKLLKKVSNDKHVFDGIWLACEHLENYFERNVRKVFPDADWDNIQPEALAEFSYELFSKRDRETSKNKPNGLKISDLHQRLLDTEPPENTKDESFETYSDDVEKLKEETVYCRTIIQFPLLLIHAYRIYLAGKAKPDIEPRLHSGRLLEIFESLIQSSPEDIEEFILTLWKVRYQFDTWVVKWVERDDSEKQELALTTISGPTSSSPYINRSKKELSALTQLQSVRNFTGERSAQYWLSPFIGSLISSKVNGKDDHAALSLLETIDNQLSLVTDTQKNASFEITKGQKPEVATWKSKQDYFSDPNGTAFEHYWFQKLEYLLWKNLKLSESSMNKYEQTKFKNYRITSKNSVEHIHPQNNSKLPHNWLHHFGNLVLLSPGENSSYSDKPESVKRAEFMKKESYDSLKSKHIFYLMGDGGDWTDLKIKQHHTHMTDILTRHYEAHL